MGLIEDGAGTGIKAKVDTEQRLLTLAVTKSRIVDRAEVGESYVAYSRHAIEVVDTNEPLVHFANGDTVRHIHIDKIVLATNSAGIVKAELFVDATLTSGGSLVLPLNTNRSNGKASIAVTRDNRSDDLVIGTVAAKEFLDMRFGEGQHTVQIEFDGALILGPGDSFGIIVEGPTIGDKVRASTYFYEDEGA